MPLLFSWPEDKLRELMAPALAGSEARVRFQTLDDAKKFRFACYNIRRSRGIGKGLSFILETTMNSDSDPVFEVLITSTPTFDMIRKTQHDDSSTKA